MITVLAAAQLPKTEVVTDIRLLLPDDPVKQDDRDLREDFGIKDSVILALVREPTVLTPQALRLTHDLAEGIGEVSGIHAVRSLFSEDNIEKTPQGLELSPFIRQPDAESVEGLKRRLDRFPAVEGILVSPDRTCTTLIVELEEGVDRERVCAAIRDAAQDRTAGTDVRPHMAGMPVSEAVLGDYVFNDLTLMIPVVCLVVVCVLYLGYRSWLLVGVALVEVIVVDIWTIGLMGFLGVPLYMIHATMPVILMALAVADEVHVFDHFTGKLKVSDGRRSAVLGTMCELWKPVMLTSVTTALGFLSFATSSMRPLRYYGLFTAFGVMSAMAFSLVITPIALQALSVPEGLETRSDSMASRWLERFGGLLARRRGPGLVALALVVLLMGYGATRVFVQDSWMGNFSKHSRVQRAYDVVRQKLLGPMLLYAELDTGQADGIKDPDFLRGLRSMEAELPGLVGVGGSFSAAQVLRKMHREFTGKGTVPPNRQASAFFLMMLEGGSYDNLWDRDYRKTLVTVFCRRDDYITGKERVSGVRRLVAEHLPDVEVRYGGDYMLSFHWIDLLPDDHRRSLVLSVGLVFLALLVFLRSLRQAVITVSPILLAILLNFGVMGLCGIPFGVATSMFSAIVIGIGIDYAVHLQSRMEHLSASAGRIEAVKGAFGSTGRAIFWDAVVVMAGFGTLLTSRMPTTRALGVVVAVGIVTSLAASFAVIPLLWSPAKRHRR